MNKIYYTYHQIEKMTQDLIRQITLDNYKPDYVVGITRGGLLPALLISQYFNVPMNTLRVSLRNFPETECNTWMAEDAFGYSNDTKNKPVTPKNILIVDDINDSGSTLEWIKKDWSDSCLPHNEDRWNQVWNKNVKFAVLVNNEASNFKDIDYTARSINKVEEPQWIVFPYEDWWK